MSLHPLTVPLLLLYTTNALSSYLNSLNPSWALEYQTPVTDRHSGGLSRWFLAEVESKG